MSDSRVASRYAKSLLELANERGELEAVQQDMKLLQDTAKESREFELLLKNPIVNSDKKQTILQKLFGSKMTRLSMEFFKIISRKNREPILVSVANEFMQQYRAYKGISQAEVTTTMPLTDELRSQFRQIVANITGNQVELKEKIDRSLIGGYVLRVGDRQIDESLSSKLTELEAELTKNQYVKEI
jgi:F-type H+-transporting ATPase subunit delta